MPRTHPPYSPEFRRQMVDLVRAGRDPDDLAREFEPTGHSIRAWVAQADRNEGRRAELAPGLTAAERDELIRLRRENKQLRLERDILQKPRPGLLGRSARCRPALPVHERKPGLFPDCRNGTRARRVKGGLLRLAATATVRPCYGRRGLVEARQNRPCQFAPNLWSAPHLCRSAWARREAQPETDRPPDARGGAGRRQPSARWPDHNPTR
jgi:transposase